MLVGNIPPEMDTETEKGRRKVNSKPCEGKCRVKIGSRKFAVFEFGTDEGAASMHGLRSIRRRLGEVNLSKTETKSVPHIPQKDRRGLGLYESHQLPF